MNFFDIKCPESVDIKKEPKIPKKQKVTKHIELTPPPVPVPEYKILKDNEVAIDRKELQTLLRSYTNKYRKWLPKEDTKFKEQYYRFLAFKLVIDAELLEELDKDIQRIVNKVNT